MEINRGYKFRIEPDEAQKDLLGQYAGMNRFVWNKALALQKERLENGENTLSYHAMSKLLPAWKAELPFLNEAPSQSLQQTLMHLDKALDEAFDKENQKRFPVFKKKGKA